MLLAVYFDKDLINVEGVALFSVLALQSAGINGAKLDAQEVDRFSADSASLRCRGGWD